MPFNIGPGELILILVIALVVLGPGKLPDVASSLGKSIREFRKAATDVSDAGRLDAPASTPAAVAPATTAAAVPPTTAAAATAPAASIAAAPAEPADLASTAPADATAADTTAADDAAPAVTAPTGTEPANDPSRS